MQTFKELKQQVNELQDGIHGKDLQLEFMENELVDVTKSVCIASEMNKLLLEMLFEITDFEKKRGKSDKTTFSKNRLLRLLDLHKIQDDLSTANYSLKATNRLFHTHYQLVRVENMKLKNQIDNISRAENF